MHFAFTSPWKMLTQKTNTLVRSKAGMWVLQARLLSRNSLSGLQEALLPLFTFMAIRHPPLLARLDVCHPQVVVVNEGEEGWVSRADFGIHPWPRALSLDLQRLHWRHLRQETHTELGAQRGSAEKSPESEIQHSPGDDDKCGPDRTQEKSP